MRKNLYELLGLDSNASEKEVRDKYKIASSSTYNDSDEWRQISDEMSDFFTNGKKAYDDKINSFDKENDELFSMVNGKKQDTINKNLMTGVVDETFPKLSLYSSNEEQKEEIKKVNVNKRTKFGKKWKIITASILGFAIFGSAVAKTNLEKIEVPVPESASISDINEFYDTSWYNLTPNNWFKDEDKTYEGDKIDLVVSNNSVKEIEDKAGMIENSNKEQIGSYYPFKYTVIHGDTIYGLEERFGKDCKISGALIEDEVVTIHTKNRKLAEEMQSFYAEEQSKKEPISFEEYVIKQDELLPNIADEFGVTCQEIMDYNPSIKSIQDINAGDKIKIPVYDKSKTY